MKKLTTHFNNWLNKKIGNQLYIIDKICEETDLNQIKWFNEFIDIDVEMYSGYDFIDCLLDNFSVYLTLRFESNFVKYIKPNGYNIHGDPYYGIFINIVEINNNDNFELRFDDEEIESLIVISNKLTLLQKEELMKNKLFSYIINKTKFKFLSNNDIRMLKLKSLNECL